MKSLDVTKDNVIHYMDVLEPLLSISVFNMTESEKKRFNKLYEWHRVMENTLEAGVLNDEY